MIIGIIGIFLFVVALFNFIGSVFVIMAVTKTTRTDLRVTGAKISILNLFTLGLGAALIYYATYSS